MEGTLQEHDLTNKPAQIYNMDECGMPLDHRPLNVAAKRGRRKVHYRVAGKKEQITVLGCANTIGQSLLPMVIFEGNWRGTRDFQWDEWEGLDQSRTLQALAKRPFHSLCSARLPLVADS